MAARVTDNAQQDQVGERVVLVAEVDMVNLHAARTVIPSTAVDAHDVPREHAIPHRLRKAPGVGRASVAVLVEVVGRPPITSPVARLGAMLPASGSNPIRVDIKDGAAVQARAGALAALPMGGRLSALLLAPHTRAGTRAKLALAERHLRGVLSERRAAGATGTTHCARPTSHGLFYRKEVVA